MKNSEINHVKLLSRFIFFILWYFKYFNFIQTCNFQEHSRRLDQLGKFKNNVVRKNVFKYTSWQLYWLGNDLLRTVAN